MLQVFWRLCESRAAFGIETDKNGPIRGEKSYEELELKAKTRIVVPGFRDPDALSGKLRTDAPTAPPEAVAWTLQVAASMGWRLHQGDIESAFLNGRPMTREIYLRAPREGLPAVDGHPAIPPGTIMRARKSVYGLNDAPFEWHAEHVRGLQEVGWTKSKINPTVMLFWREGKLEGVLNMHVDDDLMAISPWLEENILPLMRKRFVYGKWHIDKFVHCGREFSRGPKNEVFIKQVGYAKGLVQVPLANGRRTQKEQPVTEAERSVTRSAQQKLAWLARSSRSELSFDVSQLQKRITKATVQDILDTNRLIDKAKRGADKGIQIQPIPLDKLMFVAVSDSSFMNGENGSTQAGYFILAAPSDLESEGHASVSILAWRSHRLRRKVRSTLGAETMAMNEGTEEGDLFRAYAAETMNPDFDLRNWPLHVKEIRMLAITDCKSLYDHLTKQGSAPADDRRLQLDIQILRDMMENANLGVKWVATYQMLADALTKSTDSQYLSHVVSTGRFHVVRHPDIEWIYVEEKRQEKERKKEYIKENQRKRRGASAVASQQAADTGEAPASALWNAIVAGAVGALGMRAATAASRRQAPEEQRSPPPVLAPENATESDSSHSDAESDRGEAETSSRARPTSETSPSRVAQERPEEFEQNGVTWRKYKAGAGSECAHSSLRGPYKNQHGSYYICNSCAAGWRRHGAT